MKTSVESVRQIIALGMLLIALRARAQNLVVNGSFETPPVTSPTKADFPTNLFPWQTTATNFEIWTNGWKNPAAGIGPQDSADGHQNLEILSQGTNRTVWQTVPTIAGERYIFGFYYSPRPQSSSDVFQVSINSNQVFSALEDGSTLNNFDWQHFTLEFIATSNLTTLAFSDESLTGGGSGTHIDGVVLEHEPQLIIENTDNGVVLSWLSVSNETYQLQSRTNLSTGSWINVGTPVSGNGTTNIVPITPTSPQMFYRLLLGPID